MKDIEINGKKLSKMTNEELRAALESSTKQRGSTLSAPPKEKKKTKKQILDETKSL